MDYDNARDIIDSLKRTGKSKEQAIKIIQDISLNGDTAKAMNYLFEIYGRDEESFISNTELDPDVWTGLFQEYREIMAPTTEAPDVYHFFSFALVLGNTLLRRLYVWHAAMLYPNFYICLVGPTGIGRKDTAWSRGRNTLLRLYADDNPESPAMQIIPGIGSAEGLIDSLNGADKAVILNESELLSLMAKAKQEGLSNLIPKLTSLFDCPDRETLKTRQNAVTAVRPFLSIISGSTPAWLQRSLTERDLLGGFANRFCYILGEPKSPMPYPPEIDLKRLGKLVEKLNGVRDWAIDHQTGPDMGQILVPPETKEIFAEWYIPFYEKCRKHTLIASMLPRIQTFIWKFALLYAAQDKLAEITPEFLTRAMKVGEYIQASIIALFENFNDSQGKDKENRLLEYLRSEGRCCEEREVYRSLSMSAGELEKTIAPLLKIGLINRTSIKSEKGRNKTCYQAF